MCALRCCTAACRIPERRCCGSCAAALPCIGAPGLRWPQGHQREGMLLLVLPSAERLSLAVALAIGMTVVGAMVFGEVMERLQRLK